MKKSKAEMKEMPNIVAGRSDSEDDDNEETKITKKRCVNPAKRKRKEGKPEISPEQIAATVEHYMAVFEIACEDDIALNKQSKPCIQKLKYLPLLVDTLSKKPLQNAFVDHGVFTLLKNWLEPLPDGSFPNFDIRRALLLILTDQFRLDLNQHFVREQLKKSGLAKVIMFLSKSDEETLSNQKLAKDLVYNWSRDIFNISTRFEDARPPTCGEMVAKRPCIRKAPPKAPIAKQDDLELEIKNLSSEPKKVDKWSRAKLPEPTSMTYVIAPPSKVVNKCIVEDSHRTNILKTLRKIKASTKSASRRANFAY